MSSTERAPEPTMEEILSSIRRIITDDDKGEAQSAAPVAEQAPQAQPGEVSDGEADSQIIDDIARVLSGGATEVNEEEEILDLTLELGGLELVEVVEEVTLVEELEFVEEVELLEVEAPTLEEVPAPEFVAEAEAPAGPAPFYPSAEVLEEAPLEMDLSQQVEVPQAPAPEEAAAQPQPSASQAAASALEQAIAALKAGQVPTSSSAGVAAVPGLEPMPEATAAPAFAPEPIPMAIPMEAPEPEVETHPEPAPMFEAQAEIETTVETGLEADFDAQPEVAPTIEVIAEPEIESVMVEVEETIITEELVAFETPEVETGKPPFWPGEAAASEEDAALEATPAFVPEPDVEPEPVPVAAFVNGALGSDNAAQTLEDSVKDMLRPMLRQWLDDNMPRMVKDQLGDDVTPGQQD